MYKLYGERQYRNDYWNHLHLGRIGCVGVVGPVCCITSFRLSSCFGHYFNFNAFVFFSCLSLILDTFVICLLQTRLINTCVSWRKGTKNIRHSIHFGLIKIFFAPVNIHFYFWKFAVSFSPCCFFFLSLIRNDLKMNSKRQSTENAVAMKECK